MKNLNLKIRPEFDFASIWTCFPFFSNSNETTEPRRLCKQHANCPTPDPGLQCDLFYRRSSQWRPPGAAVPAKAAPIPLLPFSRLSSAPGSTCWLSAAEENKFTADRAEPDPQGKQTHTASLIEMSVCWSLILEKKKLAVEQEEIAEEHAGWVSMATLIVKHHFWEAVHNTQLNRSDSSAVLWHFKASPVICPQRESIKSQLCLREILTNTEWLTLLLQMDFFGLRAVLMFPAYHPCGIKL